MVRRGRKHRNALLPASAAAIESLESRLLLTSLHGHFREDTLLSNISEPYILTGDVFIDAGVTVTLAPGVTLASSSRLNDLSVLGSLVASGANLSFPAPSGDDYFEIKVWPGAELSLDHCTATGAGLFTLGGEAHLTNTLFSPNGNSTPTVVHHAGTATEIRGVSGSWRLTSDNDGVTLVNSTLEFLAVTDGSIDATGNTFTGSRPLAISLDPEEIQQVTQRYAPMLSQNTFTSAKRLTIIIDRGGTLAGDAYLAVPGAEVVYACRFSEGGRVESASGTTTFEPGVIMKLRYGVRFTLDSPGHAMAVHGTPQAPVTFTSLYDDTIGGDTLLDGGGAPATDRYWEGIQLEDSSARIELENARIRFAKTGVEIKRNGAEAVLKNTIVENCIVGVSSRYPLDKVTLENALIADNASTGLFLAGEGVASIRNSTIVNNGFRPANFYWPGAGLHVFAAAVTIENSIIAGNAQGIYVSDEGPGLYPELRLRNTLFYNIGGTELFWVSALEQQPALNRAGNKVADPLFVDASHGNYELAERSPAIDAAAGAVAPARDLRGRPRWDDAGLANLGSGSPPYADLGAFERQANSAPANLSVTQVADPSPLSVSADSPVHVSWTVRAGGQARATGSWSDAIYLSEDALLSPDDLRIAVVARRGDLSPGQTYEASWTGPVPPSAGFLHVLVRANDGGWLGESEYTDNVRAAPRRLQVDVPALVPGHPLNAHIEQGQWKYFRFDGADEESVRFTLDATAQRGAIQLLGRYGAVPTMLVHDLAGTQPGQPDQRLSAIHPLGPLFLGVYAESLPATGADFTLSSDLPPLAVGDVSPSRIGNTGPSTLRIHGDGFTPGSAVQLIPPGGAPVSTRVTFQDATTLFATVDPTSPLATGAYSIKVLNSASRSVVKSSAVNVTTDKALDFSASIVAPSAARPGRTLSLRIDYANLGSADLPSPLLRLVSSTPDVRWFLPGETNYIEAAAFNLLALSPDGPATILRAGQRASIAVNVQIPLQPEDVTFSVQSLGADPADGSADPIDWTQVERTMRPATANPATWTALFARLKKQLGSTWADYLRVLRTDADQWAAAGHRIYSVHELMGMELNRAKGAPVSIVTGQLLDLNSTLPVPHVQLTAFNVESAAPVFVETDAFGRFTLCNLAPGTYQIAAKSMYLPIESTFVLPPDRDLHGLAFYAVPAGRIAGLVVDSVSHAPISGAWIIASDAAGRLYHAQSDTNGSYSIESLPPERYTVVARAAGRLDGTLPPLNVEPGATQTGVDLSLPPAGRISGKVTDTASGAPLNGVVIAAFCAGQRAASAITDSDGKYLLEGLASGTWQLIASASDHLPAEAAPAALTAPAALERNLNLIAGSAIEGVVRNAANQPLPGATVTALLDGQVWQASAGADGAFRLAPLPSGMYRLIARATGYLESSLEDIQLAAPSTARGIQFSLADGLEFTGRVTGPGGAPPVADVQVILRSSTGYGYVASSDATGRFQFAGIAPGIYGVEAIATGYAGIRQMWTARSGNDVLKLTISPAPAVSGVAKGADGTTPLANARIMLLDANGSFLGETLADDGGHYQLSAVPSGTYTLRAYHDNAFFPPTALAVAAVPVTVDLVAGRVTLRGVVRTAGSLQPIPSAQLTLVRADAEDAAETPRIRTTNARGEYDFNGLVPGTYWLFCRADGKGRIARSIAIASSNAASDFNLSPAVTLRGTVKTGSFPVSGGRILVRSADSPVSDPGEHATIDAAGRFTVSNLSPGQYKLLCAADGRAPVTADATVSASGTDITLSAPDSGAPVTVSVSDSRSGVAIARAIVTLLHDGLTLADGVTRPDGTVQFPKIAPGAYQVAVYALGDSFSAPFTVGAAPVALPVSLTLPPLVGDTSALPPFSSESPAELAALRLHAAAAATQGHPIFGLEPTVWKRAGFSSRAKPADTLGPFEYPPNPVCTSVMIGGRTLSEIARDLSQQTQEVNQFIIVLDGEYRHIEEMEKEDQELRNELYQAKNSFLFQMSTLGLGSLLHGGAKTIAILIKGLAEAVVTAHNGEQFQYARNAAATILELLHKELPALYAEFLGPIGSLNEMVNLGEEIDHLTIEYERREAYDRAYDIVKQKADEYKRRFDQYAELAKTTCCEFERAGYSFEPGPLDDIMRQEGLTRSHCPEDPPSEGEEEDEQGVDVVTSEDPNEKTGPAGRGVQHFVSADASLPYTIYFENDSKAATAPAQEVRISDRLDDKLDLSTLQLTEFAFGPHLISIPPGLARYAATYDLRPFGADLLVRIEAGLDLDSRTIAWRFQSLDPQTLQPTDDPYAGFLPPNDDTRRGEGHVSYTVRPLPSLPTGAKIANIATIIFDANTPIATNQVDPHDPSKGTDPARECRITLDADAPASKVNPLPAFSQKTFTVSWSGNDAAGAGVAAYDIYVSDNKGPWKRWLTRTSLTRATFKGLPKHSYRFQSVAIDQVGHREPIPAKPDAATQTTSAPTAIASAPTLLRAPKGSCVVKVVFSAGRPIKAASLGNGDILITGPNKYRALGKLLSRKPSSNASTITATYSIPAPGGTWDSRDSGLYTISASSRQVFDTAGASAPAGSIGSFEVAIPRAKPRRRS